MTIEQLFGTLQQSVVATWRKHLRTAKYAKHIALNEFYEEMPELVDALIEAWMGANGKKIKGYENILQSSNMNTLTYLKELKKIVKQGYELVDDNEELESHLDDIMELINSTLYKVKELNEGKMDLADYINEALVNEGRDPRGSFKVIYPMVDERWEFYDFVNDPDSLTSVDADEVKAYVEDTEFENFLAYAKKKRWKKDGDAYIIPRRTTLDFVGPVDCAPHLGLFEINGDGVYISLLYDGLRYGDYDDYLKSTDNDDYEDW